MRKEGGLPEGAPLLQRAIDGLANAAATYSDPVVKGALDPHDSDQVSFIDAGLPADLTVQGGDGSNDRIYSTNDTLDHINSDLALRILRMNVACIVQELGLWLKPFEYKRFQQEPITT